MTAICNEKGRLRKNVRRIAPFLTVLLLALSAATSARIAEYARQGLRLCFGAVVGAVFPFMIISDATVAFGRFEGVPFLRKAFEGLFKINGYAITAFVTGILCGFPLGVKVACELYKNGCISKAECERLIGFSNNTGPAFVISGIGAAMRGSVFDGLILYLSTVTAACITGILFSVGQRPSREAPNIKETKFALTASVRAAGLNTVSICAFIVFFSVVCGLVTQLVKNEAVASVIISFIEVSNAAKRISLCKAFSARSSLVLTSFAVSFSGISVHAQAKSLLSGLDISMKLYYREKLLQGVLSALITLAIAVII